MDGLDHSFKDSVEKLARLFGISVGEKLERDLNIRKQHGHLLAFVLQSWFER
jgi:hypothetical protein